MELFFQYQRSLQRAIMALKEADADASEEVIEATLQDAGQFMLQQVCSYLVYYAKFVSLCAVSCLVVPPPNVRQHKTSTQELCSESVKCMALRHAAVRLAGPCMQRCECT
jgi:hypothetical protein